MKLPKIQSEGSKQIGTLLASLHEGSLRVPRFQRDFVWERSKIVALLDSIYKEYPIGSFFLWETTGKHNLFYRDMPELGILPLRPKTDDKLKFILDGQQRICSLYAAWYGLKVEFLDGKRVRVVDCSQICLDLDYLTKEADDSGNVSVFEIKHESERYVPLNKVLGEDHLQFFRTMKPERQEVFMECRRIFTTYPLSVVTVTDVTLTEAIDIFERINQGGKKLSLFDLVVASTWGDDFDLKEKYVELRDKLAEKGFGDISPEVVTHSTALILKGFCNKLNLLQLKKDEIQNNWPAIAAAIEQAVDYLSANLGVKIFAFTPYPSFIPLLAYLYYRTEGRQLNKTMAEIVHEWFWKAALSERYTAAMESKMGEDRREIFDRLLKGQKVEIRYTITADENKIAGTTISTKSALRNAIFCMLALRRPKHFITGTTFEMSHHYYSQFNSPEKHHIFPKRYLQSVGSRGENLIANFCFIPAELNKEILDEKPSVYFGLMAHKNPEFNDALDSHLLSYSEAIRQNNFEEFVQERSALIKREFERLTGSKIIQILGMNANKAIDEIELKLRLMIHSQLAKEMGEDYWEHVIPGDIRDKARKKIVEYVRKNPYIQQDRLVGFDYLSQCDIMDYSNIILKQWPVFGAFFGSKYETEKRFITLKDFRNAVKHVKEINFVLQREAEAAIEWFGLVLRGVKGNDENTDGIVVKRTILPETVEQTIERVKNEFEKRAVVAFPRWVTTTFPDNQLTIEKTGTGSNHSVKHGGELMLFYYFANYWMYGELQNTTPDELKYLREYLSKPEAVVDRKGQYGQVRFHLINDADLEVVKEIIKRRIAKNGK